MYKLIAILLLLITVGNSLAFEDDDIADAIYWAEGGHDAFYGISKTLHHGDLKEARRICLNTIRNQRVRHSKHDCGLDYMTCLWHRYCPPEAHPLNKNWLKNVTYYLNNPKGVDHAY